MEVDCVCCKGLGSLAMNQRVEHKVRSSIRAARKIVGTINFHVFS
jgi:hypothetical protein